MTRPVRGRLFLLPVVEILPEAVLPWPAANSSGRLTSALKQHSIVVASRKSDAHPDSLRRLFGYNDRPLLVICIC